MKIIIQVDNLVKALADVQGIVERKNVTPILANVMIKALDGKVNLYTTDMSLYVTKTIEAEILSEGSTTVSVAQLFETIRKLKSKDKIELELSNNHLALECNGFKGKFACLPVDDFPKPHKEKNFSNTFTIKADILKYLIAKTKLAISLDESRYYLNGIYFHKAEENGVSTLRAVATDGHRLALADAALPTGAENLEGIIIPKKTVEELHKVSEKTQSTDEVEISTSSNMVSFKFVDLVIDSNVIEGSFPDYKRVIPSNSSHIVEINTEKLLNSIDLVSTFSDDKIKAVKLNIKDTNLVVSATKENGLSSGEQSIAIVSPCEEIAASFNSKYLIDILNLIEHENTVINLSSATAPALIKNKDSDKGLFVIMPMRL